MNSKNIIYGSKEISKRIMNEKVISAKKVDNQIVPPANKKSKGKVKVKNITTDSVESFVRKGGVKSKGKLAKIRRAK